MIENQNNNNQYSNEENKNVKTSVRYKQRERFVRKRRKKQKKLKTFLRIFLFLSIIFLSYKLVTLKGWYMPDDFYTTQAPQRVEIINNKIIPSKIIYNSIKKIHPSKLPIFLVNVKPIKKEVFKIPVTDKVYVRRYGFPARMQIIIREKTPIAVFKTNINEKPMAFYTSDGAVVVNKNYMALAETKDVLKIIAYYTKDWTFEKVKEIEKIAKEVETYSNEKVEYVDMRNPNDIYVKIKTTSIRLGVLDSTVYERIKRIYTILPQIDKMDGQIKYIDLSWDKVNYLKLNNDKK